MHFEMHNINEAGHATDKTVSDGGTGEQELDRDTFALSRSGKKQVLSIITIFLCARKKLISLQRTFCFASMTDFSCGLMCTLEGMLVKDQSELHEGQCSCNVRSAFLLSYQECVGFVSFQ